MTTRLSPLSIAHVLSSFEMGGQERVALDLARGQRALGHTILAVSLAAGPEGPLGADFRALGAQAVGVPRGAGFDVSMLWRLRQLFRQEHINVVHTHNPLPLIYGALGARLAGAVLVHTKHGANPDRTRRVMLRRAAARLAGAYVAVSETTADVARRMREVPDRKLLVIPNGVDLSQLFPSPDDRKAVRDELGIPQEAFVMGTVGRLAPEKNQTLFLRAAAPLLSPRVAVLVVGDGPERSALAAARSALAQAASYVHLLGVRRDVPRVLRAMDVFVLSSRTEGLPLVIPEAMATGLPVVSTAVGGIPTVIVEGETGFLVPPDDEPALRNRLAALLADPALGRACGQKGRQIALERYAAERMVRDYLEVYERLLAKRPG